MPATPLFHVGIVVRDIDTARERLGEVLGITFGETMAFPVTFERDGERRTQEVKSTFSNEGPPFVEVVESLDDDWLLGRETAEGLHHVGAWALEGLDSKGVPPEYRAFRASGLQSGAFLSPGALYGTRLELSPHVPGLRGYTQELPGA
jgi:hypothetical protein